jgi:hypothetical protein
MLISWRATTGHPPAKPALTHDGPVRRSARVPHGRRQVAARVGQSCPARS